MAKTKVKSKKSFFSNLSRKKKILAGLVSVLAISTIGAILISSSQAAIVPFRNITQYSLPNINGGHQSLVSELTVEALDGDSPYYYAMSSTFLNAGSSFPNGHIYIGIQNHGSRVNGSQGKTAVFSIFGATVYGSPGNCVINKDGFDGYNGLGGTSCRIPYEWVMGRQYQLIYGYTNTSNLGRYWSGYVVDKTTNVSTKIADINIPASWTNGIQNYGQVWTEFFGAFPDKCTDIPLTRVRWWPVHTFSAVPVSAPFNSKPGVGICTNQQYETGPGYVIQQEGGFTNTRLPSTGKNPAPTTTAPTPGK